MPLLSSSYDSGTVPTYQSTDIGGMISTIVFGLAACVIGAITIWQGFRAWKIWRIQNVHAGFPSGKLSDPLKTFSQAKSLT